jgi:hypothetical protein
MARAASTAQSTEVDPEPARRSPSPVIQRPTGIMTTIVTMGRTMLRARGRNPVIRFRREDRLVDHGLGIGPEQFPLQGPGLGLPHGTHVDLPDHDRERQEEGRQGVEVVRDRPDEDAERVLHAQRVQDPQVVGPPGVERNQDADGRRRGVDDVGQLLAGDPVAIEQGARHRARHEDRDVRLDEDDDPDDPGQELGPAGGVHPLPGLQVVHEAPHTPRGLDRGDERADHEGEEDHVRVARRWTAPRPSASMARASPDRGFHPSRMIHPSQTPAPSDR